MFGAHGSLLCCYPAGHGVGHHTVPGPGFGVRATPLKPSSGGHPDQLSSSGVTAGFECRDGRSRIFGILGCGRVRLILHCHFCCRQFEQNFAITPSSGETGPFYPVQVASVGWQPGPPPPPAASPAADLLAGRVTPGAPPSDVSSNRCAPGHYGGGADRC